MDITIYSYISYNIKLPTTLQLLTSTNHIYKKNLTITVTITSTPSAFKIYPLAL